MKISKIILATLVLASLSGAAQNDKPIGCGKKPVKENGKKPTKEQVVKNDSLQKAQIKHRPDQCMKCGRG